MANLVSSGSPRMSRKSTPVIKVREEGEDVRGNTLTVSCMLLAFITASLNLSQTATNFRTATGTRTAFTVLNPDKFSNIQSSKPKDKVSFLFAVYHTIPLILLTSCSPIGY